jgi:hypothetical protein
MPVTHDAPTLTVFRTGQVKLSDLARRSLRGHQAVVLAAPTAIGSRWLLLPVEQPTEGAVVLYDDRGQKRFRAFALAAAVFAMLPASQKHAHLLLAEAGPLGYWLLPAGVPYKSAPDALPAAA